MAVTHFFYRPKSFLQLVLLGFTLVTLPLLGALVQAVVYLDHLAAQSRQALSRAVQATQASRTLAEQVSTMERHARQFQVLGDPTLFQAYTAAYQTFQYTVESLTALAGEEFQHRQLTVIAQKAQTIFSTLLSQPRESAQSTEALNEFVSLTEIVQALLSQNSALVERETQIMEATAAKAQRTLVWPALALMPGSALFVAIFTALIARPIRRLDLAIRRLGDGDFTSEIVVAGPRDIEHLGQRLDWLRSRLWELEADKSRFLRHMSHELKTPLTAIREGTALLAEEVVGCLNDPQQEVVEILQHNSLQLQKLIEDLLRFSATQTHSTTLECTTVRLDQLIEDVITDHKLAMMAKDLTLDLQAAAVAVLGDPEKLRLVVGNLLSNAVKFSPLGGHIQMTLRHEPSGAVLDVADSGPGIAPEEHEKIFEAFYQGQAIPHGHIKGSGLGLSIVRDCVLAHQGRIDVVQEGTGGAHLRVTLPIYLHKN